MFQTVPLSIIRSYSLYTQQWYMSYRFVDSLRAAAGSGWNWVPSCSKAVYKPVWHIPLLSVQWITPDDGRRNCLKHVEFHFQNKFEKLVHLVGFTIRCSPSSYQTLMKSEYSQHILERYSNIKFIKIWPVKRQVVHADGGTAMMELIVTFHNFVNMPKKYKTYYTLEFYIPYYLLTHSSFTEPLINSNYTT
jgi:hypothetical protein